MQDDTATLPLEEEGTPLIVLHPASPAKFLLLSFFTVNLYAYYWSYRIWVGVKAATGEDISPFWRGFFMPFWFGKLARHVRGQAGREGVPARWRIGLLHPLLLLTSISIKLPGLWSLPVLLAPLTLLPVVCTARDINFRRGVGKEESGIKGRHIGVMVAGFPFTALNLVGMILK